MTEIYFETMDAAKAEFSKMLPQNRIKSHEWNGRIFTKAGSATKEHGRLWQAIRVVEAVVHSLFALLLIPLAFTSYRKRTVTLWKEGTSGTEKFSIFVVDKQSETRRQEAEKNANAKKEALKSVKESFRNYSKLSDALKKDEDVVLAAIKDSYGEFAQEIPEETRNTRKIALALVRNDYRNYPHLTDALKKDEEIVLLAIKESYSDFAKEIPEETRNIRKIALALVRKDYRNYPHLIDALKKDEEIVLLAIKESYSDFAKEIPEETRNIRKIALALVRKDYRNYPHLTDALKKDEEIVLLAIKESYSDFAKEIPEETRNTRKIALALVQKSSQNYQHLSASMRGDREILRIAISEAFGDAYDILKLAPAHVQNDASLKRAAEERNQYLERLRREYASYANVPPPPQPQFFRPQYPYAYVPPNPVPPTDVPDDSSVDMGEKIIQRVLRQGTISGLDFTAANIPKNLKPAFRNALCRMLGLRITSNDTAIKKAYRTQVLHLHEDKRPNDEEAQKAFLFLNTAYTQADLS